MIRKHKIPAIATSVAIAGIVTYLSFRNRLGRKITKLAESFLEQKEIPANQGFVDKTFEAKMKTFGKFYRGAEWCSIFTSAVWMMSLPEAKQLIAKKLLSPSTQQTFVNFNSDTSGLFKVSQKPQKGAIVIWRSVNNPSKGHAGIFVEKTRKGYVFIEGNTSDKVTRTIRKNPKEIETNTGSILRLRGYINI